jgi:hypothetical protein
MKEVRSKIRVSDASAGETEINKEFKNYDCIKNRLDSDKFLKQKKHNLISDLN